MNDDIRDLRVDTREQLALVNSIYKRCQETGQETQRLRPRTKNVIENQRSLLDYLAVSVHAQFGKSTKAKIYYPFAMAAERFEQDIDSRMPGVRKAQPTIANAIERHQPFNQEWMGWLDGLRNEHSHRRLSKHMRTEDIRTDLHLPGGGTASVQGIGFQDAAGNEMTASQFFKVPTTDVPVTEWHFTDPDLAVPLALGLIQAGVEEVLGEVAEAISAIASAMIVAMRPTSSQPHVTATGPPRSKATKYDVKHPARIEMMVKLIAKLRNPPIARKSSCA